MCHKVLMAGCSKGGCMRTWIAISWVLLVVAVSQAGTATWTNAPAGQDWGNTANWSGGALPTDVAYINSTNGVNTPDLLNNSYTINQLYLNGFNQNPAFLSGSGNGVLTLKAANTGTGLVVFANQAGNNIFQYIYANLALGMATRTTEQVWGIGTNSTTKGPAYIFGGDLGGTGTLHISTITRNVAGTSSSFAGNGCYVEFQGASDTNGLSLDGDILVDGGHYLVYAPTNITGSANFRFGRNAPVGQDTWGGNLTFQGGFNQDTGTQRGPTFRFAPSLASNAFGSVATLQNAITINGMPSIYFWLQRGHSSVSTVFPQVVYAGPLNLGGRLYLQPRQDSGVTGVASLDATVTAANFLFFPNGVFLNQSTGARCVVNMGRSSANPASIALFPGFISDATGGYQNPLILQHSEGYMQLYGTNSTYRNGTVIGWNHDLSSGTTYAPLYDVILNHASCVQASAMQCLGLGPVTLLPGGRLYLTVTNAMTSAQQVTLQGNSAALSAIVVTDGGTIPSLASNSKGVLGLVGTSGTAFNNLVAAGVGSGVFIGAGVGGGATFTGSSIAPGGDSVYRLGGGGYGNALTITNANVLTGANSVQINAPVFSGGGSVVLTATNNFTGALTVYSALLNPATGYLQGVATNGGASYGATNGALNLFGARFITTGNGIAAKGPTLFSSESSIEHTAGVTKMTNIVATLTRTNNGVLRLRSNDATVLGSANKISVSNPGPDLTPVNNMVAPYYIYDQNGTLDFATYSAGSGFAKVTYSANTLLTSLATDLVTQNIANVANNGICYALNATVALTNGSASTITITNLGGGLIMGGSIGSSVITNPNINLDFGGNEAVIYNAGSYSIYGVITNTGGNGLTKSGAGDLITTNLNNAFTGAITVNNGGFYCTPDQDSNAGSGSLGPLSNNIYLNGAYLGAATTIPAGYTTFSSNRTITVGPLGGCLFGRYNTTALTINSKITGPGELCLPGSGMTMTLANSNNDYVGGTVIYYGSAIVTAAAKLGQGPVAIIGDNYSPLSVTMYGNDNLHYTAGTEAFLPVQIEGAATLTFRGTAPVMGSLSGEGDVILGVTATNCALTVGLDNANASFYGYISQYMGQTSSVVKAGSGTWNLYGAQSYYGQTSVTNGTLNLMGSVASNLVVYSGGTLSGIGLVGGNLTLNGTYLASTGSQITVNGNITLGGTLSLPGGTKVTSAGTSILTTSSGTISGKFATLPGGLMAKAMGNSVFLMQQSGTTCFFK